MANAVQQPRRRQPQKPEEPQQQPQEAKAESLRKILLGLTQALLEGSVADDFLQGFRYGQQARAAVQNRIGNAVNRLTSKNSPDRPLLTVSQVSQNGVSQPLLTISENGNVSSRSINGVERENLAAALLDVINGNTSTLPQWPNLRIDSIAPDGSIQELLRTDDAGNIQALQTEFAQGENAMQDTMYPLGLENVERNPYLQELGLVNEALRMRANLESSQYGDPVLANYIQARRDLESAYGPNVLEQLKDSFIDPYSVTKYAPAPADPDKTIKAIFDAKNVADQDFVTLGNYTLEVKENEGNTFYMVKDQDANLLYSSLLKEDDTLHNTTNHLHSEEIQYLGTLAGNPDVQLEGDDYTDDGLFLSEDSPKNTPNRYVESALLKIINEKQEDRDNLKRGKSLTIESEGDDYQFKVNLLTDGTYRVQDVYDPDSFAIFKKGSREENKGHHKPKIVFIKNNLSSTSKTLLAASQNITEPIEEPLKKTVGEIVRKMQLKEGEGIIVGGTGNSAKYGIRRSREGEFEKPVYYLEKADEKGDMQILRAYTANERKTLVEASAVYGFKNIVRPPLKEDSNEENKTKGKGNSEKALITLDKQEPTLLTAAYNAQKRQLTAAKNSGRRRSYTFDKVVLPYSGKDDFYTGKGSVYSGPSTSQNSPKIVPRPINIEYC